MNQSSVYLLFYYFFFLDEPFFQMDISVPESKQEVTKPVSFAKNVRTFIKCVPFRLQMRF